MKNLLLLLLLLAGCSTAFAQSPRFTIRGSIADTNKAVLPGATVMLLTPKDSALVNFGRTNDKGAFEFRNVKRAPYILKVSYVGFLPLQKEVDPGDGDVTDLGTLEIKPIQKELLEVVVKTARAPLSIRGDTIEYNASSFKVPAGSTVEELLKRLPGVQVDQDGNIKAQGEDVKKVTVDGKTFFGTDPKLATKNLPAEAIDKIQIFNDKTEAAKTTGIDDGKREKAVNLALKESHKRGGFGKVTAGAGTKDRFQLRGNYNRFNTKEQMSVLGFGNNINQTGLSWDDYQDFRGSQSFNWEDQGDFGFYSGGMYFFGGDDGMGVPLTGGYSSNRGFSRNYAGGANYNYDTKKTKLSSNYFYNQTGQTLSSTSNKQTFLPEGTFVTISGNSQGSFTRNHRGSARYEQQLDSLNTLVLIGNLRANSGNNAQFSNQNFYRAADTSQTNLDNRNNFNGLQLATTAIFRHKFLKKGRNFAASVAFNLNDSDGTAKQRSTNTFFTDSTGAGPTVVRINQDVTNSSLRTELKSSLHYIEPLTKTMFWETFYNFSLRNDKVDRDVFDLTDQGAVRNRNLSRYYTNDYTYNRVGTVLRYSDKGFNISGGLAGVWYKLAGRFASDQSATTFTNVSRQYFTVAPNFSGNYRLKNKSMGLYYNVNIQQPQTSQLQPGVVDNSNPRFIQEGNPGLLPSLTHNLNGSFSSFNPGNFVNYYLSLNYGYNINQIVYNQTIDENLITTSRPENISGGTRVGSYLNFGFPLKKTKATLNLGSSLNFNKNPIYINTVLNDTRSDNYNFRVNLDLTLFDKFTLYPYFNWGITDTRYSINSSQNQKIYNHNYGGAMNIQFPGGIFFNGQMNYQIYKLKNERFPFTQKLPILNLAVYKQFLKDNKAEVRLTAYDVFNKNRGITQQAYQNFVQKEEVQTLAQYFMLSVSYNVRGLKSQMRQNNGW
ncbi:carboxypeptidase-like protein [Larkinella arboricola]|uniref:Carboxypeptidase-like protein n=1 Tax=Larkinella arboricola TaxID=643671 RepID=A0A327X0S4_LARAB|nr:outer membrane beta-barrel protein [Larkinella arboricola]RAJ98205.1 carboxypeptidase-like protein [Larkinella arboricola]